MPGGLLQKTGTWDTAADWSTAGVPIDNSTASIPKSQQNNIVGPTGANQNVDLDYLHSHPDYNGDVGSSGSPIICAADLVHIQGGGAFYFQTKKNGGSAFVTDEVRIEAANSAARIEIGSDPTDSDSNIEIINIIRGDVTLTGTIRFSATSFVIMDPTSGTEEAKCKIVSTADVLPDYIQNSGRGEIENEVTRLVANGGQCIKAVKKAVYIDVLAGGQLVYNHPASAGDVLICRVHSGGILDLNQTEDFKEFDKTILYHGGVIHSTKTLHTLNLLDLSREG